MRIIHSTNDTPMPMSLRYPRAMAFGGVPIGVPIPPIFAATGIARASPIRPFPSAGSDLRTGVRKASIMAAVAVLLMNIEKTATTQRIPRSTVLGFVPKGLRRTFASCTSRPTLVAAMASTNPPRKSMMIGLANAPMIAL